MALTKTNFMRGMQCPKMLWLDKHKPKLKIIPPEVQARLDAGNEFGDRVMAMFGEYEEMTVYRPGTTIPDKKSMIRNTEDALNRGVSVICEAAFSNYNNYCAVDILRRTDTGYDIYKVKNSLEISEQLIRDVAFQYFVVSRCGIKIGRIFIVLNSGDDENPFLPVEVTDQVKGLYPWINDHIWDLNRVQKEAEELRIEPGEQCTNPYECWYYEYCHDKEQTK